MSDAFKIVLTSSLTILGGIVIFVLQNIVEKFYVIPIKKQKELIGEIADDLIFYASLYSNPFDLVNNRYPDLKESFLKYQQAAIKIRKNSTSLRSRTYQIPNYNFLSRIGIVIPFDNLLLVASELMGLSNSFFSNGPGHMVAQSNYKRVNKIMSLLQIPEHPLPL